MQAKEPLFQYVPTSIQAKVVCGESRSVLQTVEAGIEIVPVKELAEHMSTGVSYFEQFVWDLEHRGVADIDIPVMIIGIMA